MKKNEIKKSITAVLFLGSLVVFAIANVFFSSEMITEVGTGIKDIRSIDDLVAWIKDTESTINDELYLHDYFIDINSIIQKVLCKQEINNFAIIRDDDGMLYYGSTYNDPTDDVDAITEQVAKLKELTDSKNQKLIVMLPPSKILYGVSNVDLNLPLNNPNPRMDKLLSQLQQRKVNTLDLRITMQRSGEPLSELFFKTDHHWTPKAGFYAMQDLVKTIEDKFGENLDPNGYYCDIANYTIDTYPNIMLGTHGRKTGRFYSGLDDFDLMYLTDYEDTDFKWEDHDDEKIKGNLKKSLLHMKKLEFDNYYKQDMYSVYIDAVSDRDSITNRTMEDGAKIAVLRDSYFAPTAVFLAPMCSKIDMFWNQNEKSVKKFIEKLEEDAYDYVIVEVYPYNLKPQTFHFFEEN